MNCFLFYFQQPITTLNKMSYKCQVSQFGSAVDSKSYGRNYGKQTWTKYFWGLPCIHKTITVNKINNEIQIFPQNKANFIKMTIWQKLLRNTVFMHVFSFGWLFPRFSSLSDDFGFPLLVYSPQWPHHVSPAYLRRLLFSSAQGDRQVLVRGLKLIKNV